MKKTRFLAAGVAGLLVCSIVAFPVAGIWGYLTDGPEVLKNNFTIALDSTTTVVEKFDDTKYPDIEGTAARYYKAVQIANTGYLDAYVRVRFDFSEDDIASKTKFSWDGTNYYSLADYRNHLPHGWTYNASDGFYYYTPIVYAQGWEDIEKKLIYNENLGEYFYPKDGELITATCITTPLVTHVRTEFATAADMRSYDLNVSSDSVPFYFGSNYQEAWSNYVDQKGL